jgi:thiamine biosynthesis lipoprotein
MGVRYVLLVDAEGTLHMNPAMAARIELVDGSARVQPGPELVDEPNDAG